jgi:predicted aspartyl protease
MWGTIRAYRFIQPQKGKTRRRMKTKLLSPGFSNVNVARHVRDAIPAPLIGTSEIVFAHARCFWCDLAVAWTDSHVLSLLPVSYT